MEMVSEGGLRSSIGTYAGTFEDRSRSLLSRQPHPSRVGFKSLKSQQCR
jgi:hypothetical protein